MLAEKTGTRDVLLIKRMKRPSTPQTENTYGVDRCIQDSWSVLRNFRECARRCVRVVLLNKGRRELIILGFPVVKAVLLTHAWTETGR